MAGDICSQPPYVGRGGWSWYTGAAGWLHRAAVESIFGLVLDAEVLSLRPCLPSHWPQAELRLRRGGRTMRFVLTRASAHEVLASLADPRARVLQPGELLRWAGLSGDASFVVPLPGVSDAPPGWVRHRTDAPAAFPSTFGILQGDAMKFFAQDIEALTLHNTDFRRVLFTTARCQLVVMALQPGEDIGAELHAIDQFFRIEAGQGELIVDGVRVPLQPGSAVIVPAGAWHDILNTGKEPMKLYTLYAPPHHRHGTIHRMKDDAQADTEHFDGVTST
jgi:mannose-6-phosphate isomerase-like protein (cupin superfamily)